MAKQKHIWTMTPGGIWHPRRIGVLPAQPSEIRAESPRFKNIRTYLCASELNGERIGIAELRSHMRAWGKVPLITMLALTGAVLANSGPLSKAARKLTCEPLIQLGRGADPIGHRVADWVGRNKDRAIAHEHVVLWLQGLALLEGNDTDNGPTPTQLAWLMVLANDHLGVEQMSAPGGATPLQDLLAKTAFYSRFNSGGDSVADFVRSYQMMQMKPWHGPLSSEETWQQVQSRAFFGLSFSDYFESVLGPLVIWSTLWGKEDDHGKFIFPVVEPKKWEIEYKAPLEPLAEMFEQLSIGIDDAARHIRDTSIGGLPRLPLMFLQRPFLRLGTGELVASSVWFLREQMRLGAWDRYRNAVSSICGRKDWNPAFGQIFERWSHHISIEASRSPKFRPEIRIAARSGGPEELEDVVLVDSDRIALVSAKTRLMPGESLRDPKRVHDLTSWYSSVLINEKSREYREGALVLLNHRINRIRRGGEVGVGPNVRIYPILLTFERLGESAVLYKWVKDECEARELFRQDNVAPITFLSAGHYEQLLAVATAGVDLFEVLDRRGATDEGLVTIEVILQELGVPLRIPYVDEQFQTIADKIIEKIFKKERSGA